MFSLNFFFRVLLCADVQCLGRDIMGNVDGGFRRGHEYHIILRDFKDEVMVHANLSLGFSLFWTWVWLIFQTAFFSTALPAGSLIFLPAWVVPLVAYALTFFVLGILLKLRNYTPQGKGYLRAIPFSMSLGVAVCGGLALSPIAEPILMTVMICIGGLVLGAGTACLHVEWGRMLGHLGSRKTIVHGSLGTFGAAIFLVFITALPPVALWVCVFCIPLASMALLKSETKKTSRLYRRDCAAEINVPWKFLATAFLQGLTCGIVQAIMFLGGYSDPLILVSGYSAVIAAIALLGFALLLKMDFNQLIYQGGFVLMALGYLLFALVGSSFLGGWFIHSIGFRFVDILMWALCAYLIKQRGLPTNWVFAWTTCSLLLGQACGAVVGNATLEFQLLSGVGASSLSIIMVFILLASSLLMSDRKNLQTGWGMVRPGDKEALPTNFDMGCKLACRQYSLTVREEEIFTLLAKGRSRASVCDDLTLSKETVKTHIRNIYKKINIHSQQEIFAIVEEQQRSFGFDEEQL